MIVRMLKSSKLKASQALNFICVYSPVHRLPHGLFPHGRYSDDDRSTTIWQHYSCTICQARLRLHALHGKDLRVWLPSPSRTHGYKRI
jgi:hypothetical protein